MLLCSAGTASCWPIRTDRSNNKFNLNETEFGRQMLAGKQGLVVYKDKGEEKIAAYTQPEQLGVTLCRSRCRGGLCACS